MLSVIRLNVIMLSVIMLGVIMQNVVARRHRPANNSFNYAANANRGKGLEPSRAFLAERGKNI